MPVAERDSEVELDEVTILGQYDRVMVLCLAVPFHGTGTAWGAFVSEEDCAILILPFCHYCGVLALPS